MKTPPVYVGPTSCHDPVVKKAVFKGVGHRLRMNSSRTEYFDEAVDTCSKSFSVAGYSYQHACSELRKFRNQDPVELTKAGPKEKINDPGVKIYYVDKFDPRMPHPRKIISRNYHHIENHPIASKLFPRKNLIASCKRLPNLGEILSPTVQKTSDLNTGNGSRNGSFTVKNLLEGGLVMSADTCRGRQVRWNLFILTENLLYMDILCISNQVRSPNCVGLSTCWRTGAANFSTWAVRLMFAAGGQTQSLLVMDGNQRQQASQVTSWRAAPVTKDLGRNI